MSRRATRPVRLTPTGWAAAALDIRPLAFEMPAVAPIPTTDQREPDLVRHTGPNGWALTIWRTPDQPGPGSADVCILEAPDGTRTAVIVTGRKRGTGQDLGHALFSLMGTSGVFTYASDLPAPLWPLLPGLHHALLHPEAWFRPDATDRQAWNQARDLLMWAPYGVSADQVSTWTYAGIHTGNLLSKWRTEFGDAETIQAWAAHLTLDNARRWVGHGVAPATAAAWSTLGIPLRVSSALIGYGWTAADGDALDRAMCAVNANRPTRSNRSRWPTEADYYQAQSLAELAAEHDLTPEDVIALYRAGMTPPEVRAALATGALEMGAVHALAALRSA